MSMNWDSLLCQERLRQLLHSSPPDHSGHPSPAEKEPSERPDPDIRSAFEKDYDRSLFSTPVRRLQDKTQVFPLEPNDSVRTRLTHSLEVSNIARGLATRVADRLYEEKEISAEQKSHVVWIAQTCGLIHDLGNPPFGHAGEDAMRQWLSSHFGRSPSSELTPSQKADFERFEGNAQTLRLITRLQMTADFTGLNLTLGTLSAACKYIAAADEPNSDGHQEKKKPGYFRSEIELVKQVWGRVGTSGKRNPITYLVEAADDIVYSVIDLEDGIKKNVLSWALLKKLLAPEAADFVKEPEAFVEKRATESEFRRLDSEPSAFVELQGQQLEEARMTILRTKLIAEHMEAAVKKFEAEYDDIMQGRFHGELTDNPFSRPIMASCKQIARELVFSTPSILKLEIMGREVIRDLMTLFWEGASLRDPERKGWFPNKIYDLFSRNYRTVYEAEAKKGELPREYLQLQLVADQICGMTDSYACNLHNDLTNAR